MNLGKWLPMARALGGYAFAGAAGLAAAWAVHQHIQQRTAVLEAQARVPTVVRLVAAHDLAAGVTVDAAHLAVRDVPEAWAASDSLVPEDLGQIEGGILALPVKAGEPVLRHQVLVDKIEPVASRLAVGRRAFSLPMREIRDLPRHVRPDDRIDLYVSFAHGGRELTVPLLQGGKVLSVEGEAGGSPSITLEASTADAAKVVAARQGGVLTALLRPVADAGARLDEAPRDLPDLLGMARPARRRGVSIVYGDRLESEIDPSSASDDASGKALAATRGAP
jgi:pilus assembly protein CpaB